ncbi:hypothetical protein, partial [Mesorhizobium sp. LNJC391B00]|uniref:hypothetical protein n=1 Tax=Mesorhizobium sp. LNJC391B00 TaxID=1287273 RepID=UPI001AEBB045
DVNNHQPAMTAPSQRICRTLSTLPIRGAAAAHVSPQPAPLPSQEELLQAYSEWLFFERLLLMRDIYPGERNPYRQTALVPCNTLAAHYHFPLR